MVGISVFNIAIYQCPVYKMSSGQAEEKGCKIERCVFNQDFEKCKMMTVRDQVSG